MQDWTVCTWNTQGDFTNPHKFNEVNTLAASGRAAIFIQEGGVRNAGQHGRWIAHGGLSVGAYNERCTNYVLVDATYSRFVTVESLVLQSGSGAVVVGGGMAGRTPAAVGVGNILFVSWHSLSGHSNEDTSALIQAIESNEEYKLKYTTIVVGGDFNAAPADINGVISRGTSRTQDAWNYQYRYVIKSGQVTHPGSNHELDFFVILSQTACSDSGSRANFRGVQMTPVGPSDHNPVRMKMFV